MPPCKVDCYDYVRRTYGVPAYVGVKVQHGPNFFGRIVPAKSDLHYVHVHFDGGKSPVSVHPGELKYHVIGRDKDADLA